MPKFSERVALLSQSARAMQGRIQDFGWGGALAAGLGDGSPQRDPGEIRGEGLGAKPPEARKMLRHEAKNTYGEKKQVHTD